MSVVRGPKTERTREKGKENNTEGNGQDVMNGDVEELGPSTIKDTIISISCLINIHMHR
jgi:hypothetical protein